MNALTEASILANVLALLLKDRMISSELVERMKDWRHSGFDYLEWIAHLTSHIPDGNAYLIQSRSTAVLTRSGKDRDIRRRRSTSSRSISSSSANGTICR